MCPKQLPLPVRGPLLVKGVPVESWKRLLGFGIELGKLELKFRMATDGICNTLRGLAREIGEEDGRSARISRSRGIKEGSE